MGGTSRSAGNCSVERDWEEDRALGPLQDVKIVENTTVTREDPFRPIRTYNFSHRD